MASTVETQYRRLDLLLAGNQRDGLLAHPLGDLVVDLARQQPQRQPDHARGMREHPLDGEMRLARIGGSQHCRYTGTAGSRCSDRLRRKTDSHYASELVPAAAIAACTPLPCITMRRQASG
jgi:hypothetical protein